MFRRSSFLRFSSPPTAVLAWIGISLTACDSGSPATRPASSSSAASQLAPASNPAIKKFGEAIGGIEPTPLTQILAEPDQYGNRTVLVEGHVRRACSRKGCWMELAASDADGPGCRVTFKDYGFFVPTDSAGSTAKVQGVVQAAVVEPRDVRHYEREGAHFAQKSDDGSAKEVRLVATGVELWR
jgi:hypothetical protein